MCVYGVMALRWHAPLPGPFSVSGNVMPRISRQRGGGLGALIVVLFVVGAIGAVISFVATYWWVIVTVAGTAFGVLVAVLYTRETLKDKKVKKALMAAAESTGDAFITRSAQRVQATRDKS